MLPRLELLETEVTIKNKVGSIQNRFIEIRRKLNVIKILR
jgi:hypothetical protein